jgi:hypothetical protein
MLDKVSLVFADTASRSLANPSQSVRLDLTKSFFKVDLRKESPDVLTSPTTSRAVLTRLQRLILNIPSQGVYSISNTLCSLRNVEISLERNSAWIRMEASDVSKQLAKDIESGQVVVLHTYENQRHYLRRGWIPQMLPTDRPTWSDEAGSCYLPKDHESFNLPDGWQWDGPWEVDINKLRSASEVDKEGWEYASDFPRKFVAERSWYVAVRRRRWIRVRRLKVSHFEPPKTPRTPSMVARTFSYETSTSNNAGSQLIFVAGLENFSLKQVQDKLSPPFAAKSHCTAFSRVVHQQAKQRLSRKQLKARITSASANNTALAASQSPVIDEGGDSDDLFQHFQISNKHATRLDFEEEQDENIIVDEEKSAELDGSRQHSDPFMNTEMDFQMWKQNPTVIDSLTRDESSSVDDSNSGSQDDTELAQARKDFKFHIILEIVKASLNLDIRNSLIRIGEDYVKEILRAQSDEDQLKAVLQKKSKNSGKSVLKSDNVEDSKMGVDEVKSDEAEDFEEILNLRSASEMESKNNNVLEEKEIPRFQSDTELFEDSEDEGVELDDDELFPVITRLKSGDGSFEDNISPNLGRKPSGNLFVEMENLVLVEVIHPQVAVESFDCKGRVLLYMGDCCSGIRLIWSHNAGSALDRVKLDCSIIVGGVQCFVLPTDVDVHAEAVWINTIEDLHHLQGFLKPIMFPMQISFSLVHFFSSTFALGELRTDPSQSLFTTTIRVSIAKMHFQVDSVQLFLLVDVMKEVFAEPLPFQQALEEELTSIIYKGQLEVDPEKSALNLLQQRNRARWRADHLRWLLNTLSGDEEKQIASADTDSEVVLLRQILQDLCETIDSLGNELHAMLLICRMRIQNTQAPSEEETSSQEFELQDGGKLKLCTRLSFSLNQILAEFLQTQSKKSLLQSNMTNLTCSAILDDFVDLITNKPKHVQLEFEVGNWKVVNGLAEDHWSLLLCAMDPKFEFTEGHVFLYIRAEQKDVGGITVVPHLEIKIAAICVQITNGENTF